MAANEPRKKATKKKRARTQAKPKAASKRVAQRQPQRRVACDLCGKPANTRSTCPDCQKQICERCFYQCAQCEECEYCKECGPTKVCGSCGLRCCQSCEQECPCGRVMCEKCRCMVEEPGEMGGGMAVCQKCWDDEAEKNPHCQSCMDSDGYWVQAVGRCTSCEEHGCEDCRRSCPKCLREFCKDCAEGFVTSEKDDAAICGDCRKTGQGRA